MKFPLILAVLFLSTAICFAQTPSPTPELTEKEFEAQIKKYFEERDRILSKPQVIYYAPVMKPSGDKIGYLKRTVEYRLKGGGLIPFLSDVPEVTWISDLIEICERDLESGTEVVLSRWPLPKPSRSEIGAVFPHLAWTDKLYYEIHLSAYDNTNIPEGAYYGGGEIYLSNNRSNASLLRNGNVTARGITVGLDLDPWPYRYPGSNKIVISCEKTRQTCPSF